MAERDLINVFNDCVSRLNDGDTIEACLYRYPELADELRPMLLMSHTVRQARFDAMEVQAAHASGRARVLDVMRAKGPSPGQSQRGVSLLQLGALAASLLLVLSIFLSGGALVAESSLPGDLLYNYKRLTEQVRMELAGDPQALEDYFAQRRITEVRQLMALSRAEEVAFSGIVEARLGARWQVAGLSLTVSDGVPITGDISVGDTIAVKARTTPDGALVAEDIRLVAASTEPLPVQVPDPTPTLTPSQTAEPTETVTPEPTLTPTPMPAVTLCIPAAPEGWVSYSVQAGDTLSSLAGQTNTTLDQLMQVNCLPDARLIVAGKTIFLPFIPTQPTSSFSEDDEAGEAFQASEDVSNDAGDGSELGDEDDHEDDHSEDSNGDEDEPEHEND